MKRSVGEWLSIQTAKKPGRVVIGAILLFNLVLILISVFSVILGTLLGFCIYMVCRKGNPAAIAVTRFCTWLVQGLPVVVLLMVLYYIVFSKVAVSGAVVSVIGFTLVFASGVYGMLKSGVGVIDRGQTEAAYALGYSDRRAFFRVVLPQAIPHIMPSYKAEITAIIKATAIVGYIAVQDLTRTGDLIRRYSLIAGLFQCRTTMFLFLSSAKR